jgi:hypothetical protein
MPNIISDEKWFALVSANKEAVASGWAAPGVFATGVGPTYEVGGKQSVLYVGKSAGPLGSQVGSNFNQAQSSKASTHWMVNRINKSSFWQMIELHAPTRQSIAWTNVCKMDRVGGGIPPTSAEWQQVRDACLEALKDEILSLRPATILFATSTYLINDIRYVLDELGFERSPNAIVDGWTSVWLHRSGPQAIITKHPQGWPTSNREAVIELFSNSVP